MDDDLRELPRAAPHVDRRRGARHAFDTGDGTVESPPRIVAFDAASGTLVWRREPIQSDVEADIAVARHRLYVRTHQRLDVFDITASEGCTGSPTTCGPLWFASMDPWLDREPIVANGLVYVAGYGFGAALDAEGRQGREGIPVACTPLWRQGLASASGLRLSVAAGVLYVVDEFVDHGVVAFASS